MFIVKLRVVLDVFIIKCIVLGKVVIDINEIIIEIILYRVVL